MEKLKEAISLSVCIQKNYFSSRLDEIALLRRNFSKALVILAWFLLLFLLLFLSIVSISLAFDLEPSQSELFLHLYTINIWTLGKLIKQIVWEPAKSFIFLIYVKWTKYLHIFRRKTKRLYIHSGIRTEKAEKYKKTRLQSRI